LRFRRWGATNPANLPTSAPVIALQALGRN
jgi:hypothetical protein